MQRIQLDYIDGMRALAALYIVVNHCLQPLPHTPTLFSYGSEVVAAFITISGFCLALPMASRGDWHLDALSFYGKRARRILPPYYAAVALGLMTATFYQIHGRFGTITEQPLVAQTVWSHLLMVQNWMPAELYTLAGPFWSIALECQIYLLFPLIVLLRRRLGPWVMLFSFLAIAYLLFRGLHGLGQAQFLGTFVIGVVCAELAYRPGMRALLIAAMVVSASAFVAFHLSTTILQTLTSIFCGSGMAYLANRGEHPVRKMLGLRPLAWLGTFSYSIYLLHAILLKLSMLLIWERHPGFGRSVQPTYALWLVCTLVAITAASYGFHRLFERPFMSVRRQKTEHRLEHAST